MRSIIVFLIIPLIVSCQAMTTTSVIGSSIACSSSEKEQTFPEEGAKKNIDLSFKIRDSEEVIGFSGRAVCEYKGSICGGGTWFEIWHGDQSISHTISFSNGDELIFWPHGFCITLNEFREKCAAGSCEEADHFKLLLMFAEKRNDQDRALVTATDINRYGHKVESFNIKVADESL